MPRACRYDAVVVPCESRADLRSVGASLLTVLIDCRPVHLGNTQTSVAMRSKRAFYGFYNPLYPVTVDVRVALDNDHSLRKA